MMSGIRAKTACFVIVLALATATVHPSETLQTETPEATLAWTCPVHREVTAAEEGTCPFCERELVPTLVKQAWSCPIHAVVSEDAPGTCPICQRELYLITEEVSYACPMHPEQTSYEEGECSICHMVLVASTSSRPHQDHNPKHGGMFFMAPDNWHHLEGTYPEDGIFRAYLFNNFSEPMNAKTFEGRAVLKEVFDATTKQTRELVAYPLLASDDGAYLEAYVGDDALPREITAKVQFERNGAFERFDFIFTELSEDTEVVSDASALATDELTVPDTPNGIARAIAERNILVRDLVTSGAMTEIYLPALQAKDLAVALEAHLVSLPPQTRRELEWAVKQLVRSAWLLDDYGDLGNREKVDAAYDEFDRAVETIWSVYR